MISKRVLPGHIGLFLSSRVIFEKLKTEENPGTLAEPGTKDYVASSFWEKPMKNIISILVINLLCLGGCLSSTKEADQAQTPSDDSSGSSSLQPLDPPGSETGEDIPAEPIDFTTVGVPCEPGPTCPGEMVPEWSLLDFQPMSPEFGSFYGLEMFSGTVTLVSLHAAWCAYCRTQALHMDTLWKELGEEGFDVQFVTVNKDNAADQEYRSWMLYEHDDEGNQIFDELGNAIFRCTYPLFQDTPEDGVWALHGGNKDDFYIYHADGTLALYLPAGGDVSTRLSTTAGYNNLKSALLWVLTGLNAPDEDSE
jgi:thiol-disulfide isomerase/thioredoxin